MTIEHTIHGLDGLRAELQRYIAEAEHASVTARTKAAGEKAKSRLLAFDQALRCLEQTKLGTREPLDGGFDGDATLSDALRVVGYSAATPYNPGIRVLMDGGRFDVIGLDFDGDTNTLDVIVAQSW